MTITSLPATSFPTTSKLSPAARQTAAVDEVGDMEQPQKNAPALLERVVVNRTRRSANNDPSTERCLSPNESIQSFLDSYLSTHNEAQLKIFLDGLTDAEFQSLSRRNFERFPPVIFSVESMRRRFTEEQRSWFTNQQRDAYENPQKCKFFGRDMLALGLPDQRLLRTFQAIPPARVSSQLKTRFWPPHLLGDLTPEQRNVLSVEERAEIDRYLRECPGRVAPVVTGA